MVMKRALALTLVGTALAVLGTAANAEGLEALMHKNIGCECCDGHAAALNAAGFKVNIVPTDQLASVKVKAGVPAAIEGCHTTLIAGYVVEGHDPAAAVKRLLATKPAVKGITFPGMPPGSPGMLGPQLEPFKVLSFGADRTRTFGLE